MSTRPDIRELRLNRGLTVPVAAKEMGLSVTTLSRAENTGIRPHPGNAKKIADFYGFQVTDLWPLEVPA